MELLKLVIVDDEAILLQGLLQTYDWEQMGFRVVGSAMSGEQAIEVIEKERPDVVLTDIRMRQISGLMVMEEMAKRALTACLLCSVPTGILNMHRKPAIWVRTLIF